MSIYKKIRHLAQVAASNKQKPLISERLTKTFRALTAVLALTGATLPALAAPQWCTGTVKDLFIDADGGTAVWTSWRGSYVQVCNVNQTVGNVPPGTCMNWIALMRSAVQRGAQTTMYYPDAPACNTMPTYGAAPLPGYVMLSN